MNQVVPCEEERRSAPAPCNSDLGVRLFSDNSRIECVLNGSADGGAWLFLLISGGTCSLLRRDGHDDCSKGLLIVSPTGVDGVYSLAEDFRGFLIAVPPIVIPKGWDMPAYMSLGDKEISLLENYYHLMRNVRESREDPYTKIEMQCLCDAFVSSCSQQYKKAAFVQGSRSDEILNDFIALLELHCDCERGLAYYADSLNLSPKYLSNVISAASDKTTGQWIAEYSTKYAKRLLLNTRMTVAEIASTMRFKTSSDFCKYFKSNTGNSPNAFRNAVRRRQA